MGYNWNLNEIHVGNAGSASPSSARGERLLEPKSAKGYVSGSAAWMKYKISGAKIGDTSKYEVTSIVLEPMTAFSDYGNSRQSKTFHKERERGYQIVKKFYDKARALYRKHKSKFSSSTRAKIEEALGYAGSYLGKVKGAIDYWWDHSSKWPIDQTYKQFAGGQCSWADAGKVVKVSGGYPQYPEITFDALCPTQEEGSEHEADQMKAVTLLNAAASYTRFVERLVWTKEVERLNKNAHTRATVKRTSGKAKVVTATLRKLTLPHPVQKVMAINVESLGGIEEREPPSGTSSTSTPKKKKKSMLPLVAVAGLGIMLMARK